MLGKLIIRNLKLYFRDKVAVFFSMLSVLIVVVLFVLFLAQLQVDSITETAPGIDKTKIAFLVHSWILGGLLSLTTVTSVLGGYGTLVNDRYKKIYMSFKSAPIKPWIYPLSHILSACIIGVVVSLTAVAVYLPCIRLLCGFRLSVETLLLAVALILFSSLVSSLFCGCICSFLKTTTAFSSVSILVGTCLGFINGLYVPLGSLNQTIVDVLNFFPSLHIAAIFRKILTRDAIQAVFENAPAGIVADYMEQYGLTLRFRNAAVDADTSVIYALCFGLVCAIVMVIRLKRKNEEI